MNSYQLTGKTYCISFPVTAVGKHFKDGSDWDLSVVQMYHTCFRLIQVSKGTYRQFLRIWKVVIKLYLIYEYVKAMPELVKFLDLPDFFTLIVLSTNYSGCQLTAFMHDEEWKINTSNGV